MKYSFNLLRYLSGKTGRDACNAKSFFCSELIAFAYILMGVLTDEYLPARYMPIDFSCERELKWLNETCLDFEYSIEI